MATLTRKPLNLARLKASFDGVAEDALSAAQRAGDLILANTIPYTPEDTGDLRASGKVEVGGGFKTIQVSVTFGDNDSEYAAIVHEDMEGEKDWTVEGTGPKYLEKGVQDSLADISKIFEASLRDSMTKARVQ